MIGPVLDPKVLLSRLPSNINLGVLVLEGPVLSPEGSSSGSGKLLLAPKSMISGAGELVQAATDPSLAPRAQALTSNFCLKWSVLF